MSTTIKSWQLQCSSDALNWQIVHTAIEQTNWNSVPRQFTLSGASHLPTSGIFRGYSKLSGAIFKTLLNCSIHFIGGVKVGGYLSIKNVTLTANILVKIPVLVFGMINGIHTNLALFSIGKVGIGGRWFSVITDSTNCTLRATENFCFRGRVTISGRLSGIVSALIINSNLVTIVSIIGSFDAKDFNKVTFNSLGKVLTGGVLISSLESCIVLSRGSNTRFLANLELLPIVTNIYLRTPISGTIHAQEDSNLSIGIVGLVPQPVYITGRMHTDSVKLFFKTIILTTVNLQGVLANPTSASTFAVTYYGQIIRWSQSLSGLLFGKTGPPIIGRINSSSLVLKPEIIGIGHILCQISAITIKPSSYIILKVPGATYGQFVSEFNSLISNLKIKNFKWFKTEWSDLRTQNLQCNFKGFSLTGGHWKSVGINLSSISVYSHIYLVIPIPIKGVSHPILQPVFSLGTIIGSAPLYGTVQLNLANVISQRFIGNSNTGRLKTSSDSLKIAFRLLTIVHTIGTFAYNFLSTSLTTSIYCRISNRGQIKAIITDGTTGQFRMNTPIVPAPIYGLIKSTLLSVIPTIELQMRLKHGLLNRTLDNIGGLFKTISLCTGLINSALSKINLKLIFDFHHFAGTFFTTTELSIGNVKAHSRSLVFITLNLSLLKLNFLGSIIPTYHGRMDLDIDAYQNASIPAYNGGLFSNIAIVYSRLLYGKLQSTTKSLQYAEITGITPRIIYGLVSPNLGNMLGRFNANVTVMGRMVTTMGVESIKNIDIYLSHNIARLNILNLDLDIYKSGFKGVAAHAIVGRVLTSLLSDRVAYGLNTYVYPLRSSIKIRAAIVGSLFVVTKGITSIYFRSANSTLGTFLGGDTSPTADCTFPAPCVSELVQRIGRFIDAQDKIYWTLGWVTGKILAQHRFPIIGILYTPDLERSGSVFTTRLHGNFLSIVPFFGTMDFTLNSYVDWASGLLIYAQFKGFVIKGPLAIKMKDCVGNISLSLRVYVYGNLAADLKPTNGQIGGYHVLKGSASLSAMNVTASIGGKVPIPYKVSITLVTDWPTSKLNLYTPITTFGVFRNNYLNETTITCAFIGSIPTYVVLNLTTNIIKKSDVFGKLAYISGTFIPTARLGNVRSSIEMSTPIAGTYIGITKGHFITKLGSVAGQIILRANIYVNLALATTNMTANLLLKTPIRILAYSWSDLSLLMPTISGVVWPTGKLSISTPALVTYISSVYKVPVLVTLNLNLDSVVSEFLSVCLIGVQSDIILNSTQWNSQIFYGRFGYLSLIPNDDNWLSVGLVYYPTLYLPPEPRYTVAGTVDNKTHQQRTYSMILFHKTTGEFVQKLPLNQQVPFDYAFSTVASGDYFVLCKPTQTVVGSKAHVVTVQFEKEPIFA